MSHCYDRPIMHQVREIHRRFQEKGIGARDVLIVAHAHFTRVLIARWLEAPVTLGMLNDPCFR